MQNSTAPINGLTLNILKNTQKQKIQNLKILQIKISMK